MYNMSCFKSCCLIDVSRVIVRFLPLWDISPCHHDIVSICFHGSKNISTDQLWMWFVATFSPSQKVGWLQYSTYESLEQWKKPWLVRPHRGWNPTQLFRDYFINYEIRTPSLTNQDSMESKGPVFFSWLTWSRVTWYCTQIWGIFPLFFHRENGDVLRANRFSPPNKKLGCGEGVIVLRIVP